MKKIKPKLLLMALACCFAANSYAFQGNAFCPPIANMKYENTQWTGVNNSPYNIKFMSDTGVPESRLSALDTSTYNSNNSLTCLYSSTAGIVSVASLPYSFKLCKNITGEDYVFPSNSHCPT